ncbi:arginine N-succinyltransferase [Novosphingobium sp. 1949]|uniref:Arginine N-succinyltransferase n=1 Tax=Novosphingobium organovorum TaxID=2930092 RepID=A0ABT0BAV9_9SPHN|nr:arginine N-succinyltransferase [Novosphingobium organovorum]MCJ2181983.1 arginine N-succinyltransferase [Novosphingobium organovorum]
MHFVRPGGLPEDRAVLTERLALSERSFAGDGAPSEAWYTLLLEDTASGAIDGIASVRAAVGVRRPHFSFRVVTLALYSSPFLRLPFEQADRMLTVC